jgi:Asp-tRNA(Asn)/Glu-tRNA(Gln) amidotransferase A subunit family amidase
MAPAELNRLSSVELHSAVVRGELSCLEVATAFIERITKRDDIVKAWAHFDAEAVLAQARQLDGASVRGPLHGIPIGVKDVIDTFDMPTQMGSPIYRGYQPAADASCVAAVRTAGALILGKTVTCEFAGVAAAQTTNPHDATRTPGGSSSGSAAAVADHMVPLAFGTQTGGSILRPAAFCGVVGFKPSFGLVNPAGVKAAAESLDTVGFLARTVEDVELAMRIVTRAAAVRWLPADGRLRIGLCRTPNWDHAEPATQHGVLDAARRLEAAGHEVREIELPQAFGELAATRETINDYERARGLAHEWRTQPKLISEKLAQSIRRGLALPAERYIEALRHLERCRRLLEPSFESVSILLAPTTNGEAPRGLDDTGDHRFQSLWTQMRTPTLHLPTNVGPNRMPIGIQLVGPIYGDAALLAAAQLVYRTLGQGPGL